MMDLPGYFRKNIHKYVSSGDSIVIALSGGPDSVALLRLFSAVKDEYKLKLFAAHFNHLLRGRASFRDAEFAGKLCLSMSIPFLTAEKDIKKISGRHKGGVEKNARNERYKFLIKCAEKTGARLIAAGHNLDDNAETVLMRLLTGAGAEGLSGITDKREIFPAEFGLPAGKPGAGRFTLIRPLSGVRKKDILEFLKAGKVKYAVDATNEANIYLRNKLRNIIIPEIARQINPRVRENLADAGAILSAENLYMELKAGEAYAGLVTPVKNGVRINLAGFLKLHAALQRRVARKALKYVFKSSRRAGFEPVEAVLGCSRDRVTRQLPEGFLCFADKNVIAISAPARGKRPAAVSIASARTKEVFFNGYKFTFKAADSSGYMDFKDPCKAYMDLSRVKFPLKIRLKKPGDSFVPYGMDSEVRLKKFYNTCPLDSGAPVLADSEKIIWAAGGRIAESVKVVPSTRKVLAVAVEKPAN